MFSTTRTTRRWRALAVASALVLSCWGCEEPGQEYAEVNEHLPAPATKALKVLRSGFDEGLKDALKGSAKLVGTHARFDDRAAKVEGAAAINLKFGRTSDRIFNQANAPPAWAVRTVAQSGDMKTHEMDKQFHTFDIGNGRRGHMEAIGLSIECIRCHGRDSALADGMKERLKAEFPQGAAVGYKGNQLRGWYWLEYDAAK